MCSSRNSDSNSKNMSLFHWISNLCIQSNFAMCLRLQLTLSIFAVISFFHQILVFFLFAHFSPHFFFCSIFRSFHILYSDINESLIEQKITSVQSDAYFKEPVDKKLVYMFDAKLKWIEWAANSYPFLESVRVRRVYRNMRRKKKKKKKNSQSQALKYFYRIFIRFLKLHLRPDMNGN